jgi:hypothetical protein
MADVLARLVYRMLRYGEQYVDKGMKYYEQKYRQPEIRRIQKKAKDLAFVVHQSRLVPNKEFPTVSLRPF